MKHQAVFPSKNKSRKIKCRLLQVMFVALRVNTLVKDAERGCQKHTHTHTHTLTQKKKKKKGNVFLASKTSEKFQICYKIHLDF